MTRQVEAGRRAALKRLFSGRGHTLLTNPKNPYIELEVRTDGRSIFTLYTSGKLVSTVREGDGEGLLLEDEIARLLGAPVAREAKSPASPPGRGSREGLAWLGGIDETGTGELLGSAVVGGVLMPAALAPRVDAVCGHVETKNARTSAGWERLGEQLADLRAQGLVASLLPIPNRLFDRWGKNGLLDLTAVRMVADLLAGAGLADARDLSWVEVALDDYGAGGLLRAARASWSERDLRVLVETKADVRHLATRAASVLARAARAREMGGLAADAEDGPIGTGNPGHPETKAWLRRRVRSGLGWPSFVKTSFRTITDLDRAEPVTKTPVPALDMLLDDVGAEGLLAGRLDTSEAKLRLSDRETTDCLVVDASGRVAGLRKPAPVTGLLPVLCGGLVLDGLLDDLALLDRLLDRETGLLSGWRLLLPPEQDPGDPACRALLAAHARGIVHLLPTRHADPVERALAHSAVRVLRKDDRQGWRLVVQV